MSNGAFSILKVSDPRPPPHFYDHVLDHTTLHFRLKYTPSPPPSCVTEFMNCPFRLEVIEIVGVLGQGRVQKIIQASNTAVIFPLWSAKTLRAIASAGGALSYSINTSREATGSNA